MKLKYVVFIIIFLLLVSFVTSSVTLRQGEVYEVKQKELIVESIKADMVKFNVDGVKNIISVGEQKEVNGVNILVESVFYVDEPEDRIVTVVISIAFYCGDSNCDTEHNETKENCCEDCGCNTGYVCSDRVCKTEALVEKEVAEDEEKKRDKCEKDIDCDDNDPSTEDVCRSIPGKPNECLNIPPICKTDLDCDDLDPCTVDRCESNDCFNTKVPEFIACLNEQETQELEETVEEESAKITPQETPSEEPKVNSSKIRGNLIWILVAVLVTVIGILAMLLKWKKKQEPQEGFIKKN